MNCWDESKLLKTVEDLAQSVKKIAKVLETPAEPLVVEPGAFATAPVLSWEDAVRVLKDTCVEASMCGPGCMMYGWCQVNLPDDLAPHSWTDPSGAGV